MNQKPVLRILQVFSTLGVGGAETWLIALLRHIKLIEDNLPFKVQFDICLTSGNRGIFDDEAALLGANLYYPHFCRGSLISFIHEFRSILAKGGYDVIHDHQDYMAGIHFFFGVGYLPPVRISHIHNPLLHLDSYRMSYLRKITAKIGKNLLSKMATHIIGTSTQIVTEYGFNDDSFRNVKCGVLHCGFDVKQFMGNNEFYYLSICSEFGWHSRVKIVLFVGRLNSNLNQKNPSFALEVIKTCIGKDPDIRFLMAGDGQNERIQFEEQVKQCGLQQSIRIIGARSDIPRLMLGSNLLLFPSVGEGLGMVAVEAQAAGLRVLASDAVPRECEVISGMVFFKSLDIGVLNWANEALRLLSLPRPNLLECNKALENSLFSIDNSVASLLKIYSGFDPMP